ncbi:DUF6236 family protein [Chromobacterium sp. ATCC 53434]|uniref:DUF6236 family protein n=1 Tax=Chromobacterium sp. (strain ATCC 53434 / SC 14030) TaxID=2059672 RepID=UPI0013054628|nr:DUF6236 family protein [Chromobacterium sp. ATCC 53434]
MSNGVLYYPSINLSSIEYLKALSLFYDHLYRIVPAGVDIRDADGVEYLEDIGFVRPGLNPAPYVEATSDVFLNKTKEWSAAALDTGDEAVFVHEDKIDVVVRGIFSDLGFDNDGGWYSVPTDLASNYMLYLASEIANRNNLSLVTDNWGAWTATSYFNLNGGVEELCSPPDVEVSEFALFSFVMSDFVPLNLVDISLEDIERFRRTRRDEIVAFRDSISSLRKELNEVLDHGVRLDVINSKIKEYDKALSDYKRSASLINIKGWGGVSMMGIPMPSAITNHLSLDARSMFALGVSGLAIGGLYSLVNKKKDLIDLSRANPASFIFHVERTFKNYTLKRGGGDINFHAWNCMEEYVND